MDQSNVVNPDRLERMRASARLALILVGLALCVSLVLLFSDRYKPFLLVFVVTLLLYFGYAKPLEKKFYRTWQKERLSRTFRRYFGRPPVPADVPSGFRDELEQDLILPIDQEKSRGMAVHRYFVAEDKGLELCDLSFPIRLTMPGGKHVFRVVTGSLVRFHLTKEHPLWDLRLVAEKIMPAREFERYYRGQGMTSITCTRNWKNMDMCLFESADAPRFEDSPTNDLLRMLSNRTSGSLIFGIHGDFMYIFLHHRVFIPREPELKRPVSAKELYEDSFPEMGIILSIVKRIGTLSGAVSGAASAIPDEDSGAAGNMAVAAADDGVQ